jgi:enolase
LFGLDAAATEFFDGKDYQIGKKWFTQEKLLEYYEKLSEGFALDSIEDGFAEDDWRGWREMTAALGKKMLVIGDDLLVTKKERVEMAVEKNACNAMIIKPNQVGSVTAAVSAAKCARKNGFKLVVSHRSGETEDPFISHLAVGLGVEYVKFGAPCRSERLAKYNELLRISEAF